MVSYEQLQKMKVNELRAAVRSWQHSNRIRGYSTMKKAQLIDEIMKEVNFGQPAEVSLEKHLKKVIPKPVPKPRRSPPKPKAKPEEESVLLDDKVVKFREGALRRQMRLKPSEKFTRSQLLKIAKTPTNKMFTAFGREYKATRLLKQRAAFGATLMK